MDYNHEITPAAFITAEIDKYNQHRHALTNCGLVGLYTDQELVTYIGSIGMLLNNTFPKLASLSVQEQQEYATRLLTIMQAHFREASGTMRKPLAFATMVANMISTLGKAVKLNLVTAELQTRIIPQMLFAFANCMEYMSNKQTRWCLTGFARMNIRWNNFEPEIITQFTDNLLQFIQNIDPANLITLIKVLYSMDFDWDNDQQIKPAITAQLLNLANNPATNMKNLAIMVHELGNTRAGSWISESLQRQIFTTFQRRAQTLSTDNFILYFKGMLLLARANLTVANTALTSECMDYCNNALRMRARNIINIRDTSASMILASRIYAIMRNHHTTLEQKITLILENRPLKIRPLRARPAPLAVAAPLIHTPDEPATAAVPSPLEPAPETSTAIYKLPYVTAKDLAARQKLIAQQQKAKQQKSAPSAVKTTASGMHKPARSHKTATIFAPPTKPLPQIPDTTVSKIKRMHAKGRELGLEINKGATPAETYMNLVTALHNHLQPTANKLSIMELIKIGQELRGNNTNPVTPERLAELTAIFLPGAR